MSTLYVNALGYSIPTPSDVVEKDAWVLSLCGMTVTETPVNEVLEIKIGNCTAEWILGEEEDGS